MCVRARALAHTRICSWIPLELELQRQWWAIQHGCWEPNSMALEKQHLLTIELFRQPWLVFFVFDFVVVDIIRGKGMTFTHFELCEEAPFASEFGGSSPNGPLLQLVVRRQMTEGGRPLTAGGAIEQQRERKSPGSPKLPSGTGPQWQKELSQGPTSQVSHLPTAPPRGWNIQRMDLQYSSYGGGVRSWKATGRWASKVWQASSLFDMISPLKVIIATVTKPPEFILVTLKNQKQSQGLLTREWKHRFWFSPTGYWTITKPKWYKKCDGPWVFSEEQIAPRCRVGEKGFLIK